MRKWAWIPTGRGNAPLDRIRLDGGRASINQRQLRRQGLAGWQAGTTAGLLAAWELTAHPGVFFDVGANAGLYSLLCRRLWPDMDVVAFEPSPETLSAGRSWAAFNDSDFTFEALALSDRSGVAALYLSDVSDASNSLVEGFKEASSTITVDVSTLDAYVQRVGRIPTVVKIDVEQHEPAVIRGARTTLADHRPVLVVELIPEERVPSSISRETHDLLIDMGYAGRILEDDNWIYWHGGLPTWFEDALAGWRHAVDRCLPQKELPPPPVFGNADGV